MALRRGFKSEANKYAKEMREELGRKPYEPLCPWELARLLEIPILPLSEFSVSDPQAVSVLSNGAQDKFSAVSVFEGRKRLIVHNDAHHPYRQAANIAHELSHAILLHPPTPPFTGDGERNFNSEVRSMEEEANWLGPALLISEEAALHIVRNKMPLNFASEFYSASEQLITMRINVTGSRKRAKRFRGSK